MPKNIIEELNNFGLTENDSLVYLFLLQKGVSFPPSKIAYGIDIHRQYVYNSIEKLLKLHLIENTTKGKRLTYKALPPYQVTKIAKKNLEQANTLEKELNLISSVGHEQDFEVYVGEKQVDDFEVEVLNNLQENETQYIISGNTEAFMSFFDNRYEEYSHIAKKKRLTTYYVSCPSDEPYARRAKDAHYAFHAKILPNLPQTLISTVVRFNSVTFYSMAKPPIIYIIKSKIIADDYKKFFDMLWNLPGNEL